MPVILTSCTFQFLPIDHPWKPVCKRREGSEERTERRISIVCRLCEMFFWDDVQETPLPSAEERKYLPSASASTRAGFVLQRLVDTVGPDPVPAASPGSKARHRDKTVNTSRSATGLCISGTPFDAFWKQIAHCVPAWEVGQNPYLHFIKDKAESWKLFAWGHRLSHWHSKKQTAGLVTP